MWQEAVLACAMISNDHDYTQKVLQSVKDFLSKHWPDLEILEYRIELL